LGSKADICAAPAHVRFTPNSDRESRHPQPVMSALSPKADMCSAQAHVCYGPIADIRKAEAYSAGRAKPCGSNCGHEQHNESKFYCAIPAIRRNAKISFDKAHVDSYLTRNTNSPRPVSLVTAT